MAPPTGKSKRPKRPNGPTAVETTETTETTEGSSREVETTERTEIVEPTHMGRRLAVGIPLAILGIALIAGGAFLHAPDAVRAALILVGGGFVLGGGWLIAGALGIGPTKTDDGQLPSAHDLPHVRRVRTQTLKETGLPKEGQMPPKHGHMPPKEPGSAN